MLCETAAVDKDGWVWRNRGIGNLREISSAHNDAIITNNYP